MLAYTFKLFTLDTWNLGSAQCTSWCKTSTSNQSGITDHNDHPIIGVLVVQSVLISLNKCLKSNYQRLLKCFLIVLLLPLKPYYCTSDFIWCVAQGSTLRKDHQQINLQTLWKNRHNKRTPPVIVTCSLSKTMKSLRDDELMSLTYLNVGKLFLFIQSIHCKTSVQTIPWDVCICSHDNRKVSSMGRIGGCSSQINNWLTDSRCGQPKSLQCPTDFLFVVLAWHEPQKVHVLSWLVLLSS